MQTENIVSQSVPSWAQAAIAAHQKAEADAAEKARIEQEAADQKLREEEAARDKHQGAILTEALRTILGEDMATEILGGKDVVLDKPYVTQGTYSFVYIQPRYKLSKKFGEVGEVEQYFFALKRRVPKEWTEWLGNWKHNLTYTPIETVDELGEAVIRLEKNFKDFEQFVADRIKDREFNEAMEQAEKALTPVQPIEDNKPSLDWWTERAVILLENIASEVRNGHGLNADGELILSMAKFVKSTNQTYEY